MRPRILMVEDEEAIARPLAETLEREGFATTHVPNGRDALARFDPSRTDLVLLDLMLPDIDGRDVCREIRARSDVPIVIFSARGEEIDRVLGLELGADDYVAKPFSSRELIARMRAVLRRSRGRRRVPAERIGDVVLDVASRSVTKAGEPVSLTVKEFDLLRCLMDNAGTVVTREEIMEEVWDTHWFGSTKTLDVHLSALRKKLDDDPASPTYIRTVRGVGLRFSTPDELEAAKAS